MSNEEHKSLRELFESGKCGRLVPTVFSSEFRFELSNELELFNMLVEKVEGFKPYVDKIFEVTYVMLGDNINYLIQLLHDSCEKIDFKLLLFENSKHNETLEYSGRIVLQSFKYSDLNYSDKDMLRLRVKFKIDSIAVK